MMREDNPIQEIEIRPSISEDEIGIRNVQVITWKSTYRGIIPDDILDQMTVDNFSRRPKIVDPMLMKSRRSFVAVNQSKQIVGFAVGGAARSPDWHYESELWAIYVLPSEQGKGIGKKLFSAFWSAIEGDYQNLIIWALEKNNASHQFYENRKGQRLQLKKFFKWENEAIATEVSYGWDLYK